MAALYPCVIVSGRARRDLLDKLGGVRVQSAIGNHGAETESDSNGAPPTGGAMEERVMELEIGALPGVWVEDKGLSLAVHYRQSSQKAEARRRILDGSTAICKQVRVFGGKQVVNLVMERRSPQGRSSGRRTGTPGVRLGALRG